MAWAGACLVREAAAAVAGWDDRQSDAVPCNWRFGMAPVARFERSLTQAREWLPRDSVVLFSSPAGACGAEFYRWRWAAYLMPSLHVRTPEWFVDRGKVTYTLTYQRRPAAPAGCRLEYLRDLDDGQIHRVLCP